MKYSKMTKSLNELTNGELDQLIANGHIGTNTKQIKELWHFYVSVEEEKKRRNLQLREIKKILPIGNYYRTNTAFGTYLFRVIDCKEAPKGMHITHFCAIDGVKVDKNKLTRINTSNVKNYELNPAVEFGWNAETQHMVFWIKGDFASDEVIEQTEEQNKDFVRTLDLLGFDANLTLFLNKDICYKK